MRERDLCFEREIFPILAFLRNFKYIGMTISIVRDLMPSGLWLRKSNCGKTTRMKEMKERHVQN